MVTVAELMIENVYTVSIEDNIFHAGSIMAEHNISCLLIVREKKIIGIITIRDILNKVLLAGADPKTTFVEYVMSHPVKTVDEHEDASVVSNLMTEHRIKQIPVVKGGNLVGIITQTDIVRSYNDMLQKEKKSEKYDPSSDVVI